MQSSSAHRTYQSTIDYYQTLRDSVYVRTANHVGKPARIDGVTFDTAIQADNWSNLSGPNNRQAQASWSWADAYRHYKSFPKRFEIAVWVGGSLCGICYGKPSHGKTKLRLDLIGSTPERPSPLGTAVFPVISIAATAYAIAIGADEICILDPINEKVSQYYMKFGYGAPAVYHANRIALRKSV